METSAGGSNHPFSSPIVEEMKRPNGYLQFVAIVVKNPRSFLHVEIVVMKSGEKVSR